MTETFAPRTWIDTIAPPVRLFRGAHQYAAALPIVRRSGHDPDEALSIRYGWETNTCIGEFDEFNTAGRWQIRLAPAPFGLYLLWMGSLMPVGRLSPWLWPAVAWLAAQIVLLAAYDPLAGLYEVLKP